jgi:hypothetical protein
MLPRYHEFDRALHSEQIARFHLPKFDTAEVVVSANAQLSADEFAERDAEIGRDLLVHL